MMSKILIEDFPVNHERYAFFYFKKIIYFLFSLVSEYIYHIPVLIPHIIRQLFTIQSLAWTYRIRVMLIFFTVIAYVLSPLDILPESVLGFLGFFDDFFIILCAALYIIIVYREYLSRG